MSLTSCLKKAGAALHADDRAAILKRSAVLRRGGLSADDAARQAVDEQLGVVRGLMDGTRAAPQDEAPKMVEQTKSVAPAPANETRPTAAPIADAGEKIGGARKDQWAARGLSVSDLDAMTESEGATHAKKASVWTPDYAAIAKDADPVVAAMVKVVYDSLAAKPKENTPEGRRDYVRAMQAVRKVYGSVKTVDEAKQAYRKLRSELGITSESYRFSTTPEDKAAYRALFSVYKGRSDPFVFDYTMAKRAKSLVNDGFPGEVAPWKRRIAIRAAGGAGLTARGVELAIAEAAEFGTSLTPEQARAGYFEARLQSTRKTVAIAATREGAEAAAAAHYESMKSAKDGGEAPERPHLDEIIREGLPERRDHDVTSQDFIDTFGWRGIEFGNWAAQDERQRLLNLAYDSLHDLAQVLNVPPQALSLNGQMGLAFGARGGGKFAAHYEPGRLVINMTKLRGAGSLAHEWAHALDHYLGELDQPNAYTVNARGASGWYSQARYNGQPQPRMVKDAAGKWVNKTAMRLENLRPELAQKIDAVMKRLYETPIPPEQAISMEQAEIARLKGYIAGERAPRIKQTYAESLARHEQILADLQAGKPSERTTRSSYAGEAQKLSGKSIDGYWVRPTEMFARAFESYVFDRVTEMGARSDYLVHGVESDRYADSERYKGNPYPVGQERQDINRALGDFVSELKTRETDKGVAIFSRKADPERQALRWTSTDSNTAGPEFYSPGASLIAIQQLNTQDDFADDALPLGHNAQVAEGNTAHRFLIVDPDGGVMGEAALEVNPAGEVEAIHDIEITDKRQGAGRQAVAAILANTAGPVRIIDILDQSDAFWQKMGAGYKDTYGNATADWSSYRQARNNARGIQGQGPRSGEGLEAGRPAEGQPGSRQEGEVGPKANRLAELLRGSSGKGLPVRLAEIYAGQYEAAGLHRVNVARNFDDLPASLRAKLSGYGDDVRGAYFPSTDQIYVFTDNLATPDELHFVVMHEAFHRGVGALFGDQGRRLMRQMYATNQRLRERADSVASELKISRDEAIEEALADMAGEGKAQNLRGWKRLAGLIRNWLRGLAQRLGLQMRFTDAQIEAFVAGVSRAGINRDVAAQGEADGLDVPRVTTGADLAAASRVEPQFSRTTPLAGINQQVIRDALADRFKSAGEQVNWWQKTLGTQYDKAKAHPEYGKVFKHVQQYIEDTSTLANEAADQAPEILPKLESVRDVFAAAKRGLSATDQKAIAAPIFEGTLNWSRQGGKLVKFDDLQAHADQMSSADKERILFRDGKVTETELKRWKATPLDIYEGAIRNRYAQEYLQPGVVFTRAELQQVYGLNDAQIAQYEQFRSAVNESLDQVAAADALRLLGEATPEIRAAAMGDRAGFRAAVEAHIGELVRTEEDTDKRDRLQNTLADIIEKFDKVDQLKARGYAPLMRFGRYFVGIKGAEGQQEFFGLYETRAEANKMARELGADPEFSGRVEQGTMSQEAFKLFSGIPVESLEMFADAIGAEQSAVYQEWLRLTKNNRSALKRLIKRKGTEGFSSEVTRVLASFVTSNARMAAGAMNLPQAKEAAESIRAGDIKDEGVQLIEAVQNPTDTAGVLRGMMFAHFIGGSVASALVNVTQPVMMTLPWLSQWGGPVKAASRLMASARQAAGGKITDTELAEALKRAEKDGIVSPQEIHHLTAEAMASWGKNPVLKRAAFLWGAPFSVAEQFNRRVTFLAAYQTAKAEGMADPFAFAEEAVVETQGLYNKGNAPNWARNPIGATALTFKQYSIHYLEWIKRMWNTGEPGSKERTEGRKAVLFAMALLFLAGGSEGLPFAEDVNDLADTVMQALGFDTSAKGWKREFIARTLGMGDTGADVVMRGMSALPGIPLDVSMRMGMGNLLPGTGMLMRSNTDLSRDVLELAGPVGGLVGQYKDAGRKVLDGKVGEAALGVLPGAMQNVGKAASMWINGEARDAKGRRVMATDELDAVMKLIGFQPAELARENAKISEQDKRIKLARVVESSIADQWAQGLREKDVNMVNEARQQLTEWNASNPESRIAISSAQIKRRLKDMQADKADRFARTAPKEMRGSVAEALR